MKNSKEIQRATFGMSPGRRILAILECVVRSAVMMYTLAILAAVTTELLAYISPTSTAFAKGWLYEWQPLAVGTAYLGGFVGLLISLPYKDSSVILYRFYNPTLEEIAKYKKQEAKKIEKMIEANTAYIKSLEETIYATREANEKLDMSLQKLQLA